MNLYLRLFFHLLVGRFQGSLTTADETETRFRVWPQDIDLFGHMNNGRYLQIMDVARSHWMLRCGALGVMARQRWGAALGGGSIRFRRPLKPFQSYQVQTRLLCWDRRWFFLEHGFIDAEGHTVAVGISRAALRSRRGWVGTQEVMDHLDPGAQSAPIPAYLSTLLNAEEAMQAAFEKGQSAPEDPSASLAVVERGEAA